MTEALEVKVLLGRVGAVVVPLHQVGGLHADLALLARLATLLRVRVLDLQARASLELRRARFGPSCEMALTLTLQPA